jgi:antitoxin (DNA-binding transcriptional repressor) of toxin-antitoxin stability system
VERAAAGEEIIIARAGRPQARLVPLATPREPRKLGLCAGQHYRIAEDFDEIPEDLLAAFEGRDL